MEGDWTFNEKDCDYWGHETYNTKEEAIESAKGYLSDDQLVMYVGRCELVALPTYVDAWNILENLNENYGEKCVDYDDELLDSITDDDAEWFENKLQELMNKFYEERSIKSIRYTIVDMEEVKLESI